MVWQLIKTFRETGSVKDMQRSGRPTTLTDKITDISDHIMQSPRKAVHRLSQQMGMSYESRKVLTKHFHLQPYKITSVYELKECDHKKRVQYCQWCWSLIIANGKNILHVMFFSDEA
jgi:hypothetical protein